MGRARRLGGGSRRTFFECESITHTRMGFGSYDESEQENQEIETDYDEEGVKTEESSHEGSVEYEIEASNEELLDQLADIKDE